MKQKWHMISQAESQALTPSSLWLLPLQPLRRSVQAHKWICWKKPRATPSPSRITGCTWWWERAGPRSSSTGASGLSLSSSSSFLVSLSTSGRVALLLQVSPPSGLGRSGGALAHKVQHTWVWKVSSRPGWLRPGTAAVELPSFLIEPKSGSRSRLKLWPGMHEKSPESRWGRKTHDILINYLILLVSGPWMFQSCLLLPNVFISSQ